MISQRTKMRMKDIASKKYWIVGNPPFGFDNYQIVDNQVKKEENEK